MGWPLLTSTDGNPRLANNTVLALLMMDCCSRLIAVFLAAVHLIAGAVLTQHSYMEHSMQEEGFSFFHCDERPVW